MALIFYERVGHEGRRPSPFSWRIRYALAHKGLDFEVRPVRFADVGTIRALSGQDLIPTPIDSFIGLSGLSGAATSGRGCWR